MLSCLVLNRHLPFRPFRSGFTLVELIIVVAIIGILASIAVPNLLEAQVRSKTARVRNDLRAIEVALEVYHADHRMYPSSTGGIGLRAQLYKLTTPVAYISSIPIDPFTLEIYHYVTVEPYPTFDAAFGRWVLSSFGPDRVANYTYDWDTYDFDYVRYDPTNGSVSAGDILRTQREKE